MTEPKPDRAEKIQRFRFPAKLRVKSRLDFNAAFSRGKVLADDTLVVHAVRAPESPTCLGLSLSKKVGNAPIRNRWKRLIREAFRLNRSKLPSGFKLVIRPRKGAQPEFHRIERSLQNLARRLERIS